MPFNNEKKASYGRNLILMLVLTIITFTVILKGNDMNHLISSLKSADGRWLLFGLCCMFVFVSCEALNMYQISRSLGWPLGLSRCEQYAFIGFYFSSITPSASGGQPVQMYYMKKDRIPLANSSVMILFIVFVYQMAMLLLAGIMALIYPNLALRTAGHLRYLLPFGLVINGGAAIVMALFLSSEKLVQKILLFSLRAGTWFHLVKHPQKSRQRILTELKQYHHSAQLIKQKPLLFLRVLLTSLLQMAALSSVPYCTYRALGYTTFSPGELVTCQSILTVSASAIPTPGAVGAAEGGFLFAFKDIFDADSLKTAMLLSRGISLYLFLLISFCVCIAVQIRISRSKF